MQKILPMKKIIALGITALISTLVYKTSSASSSVSTENNLNRIFELVSKEFFSKKSLCNESPKHLPEEPVEVMFKKAQELSAKNNHCKAADIYYEIRRHYPIKPHYMEATKQLLSSYFAAGDYGLLINTANFLIEGNLNETKHGGELKGTALEEEARFLIIRSVYVQMKEAGSKGNQEWTEYALGIKGNLEDKYMQNLGFDNFIDKYPKSNLTQIVSQWRADASNQLAYHYLNVGHLYFKRGDYVAALGRYDLINRWGISVEAFGESMYHSISALNELSYEILDPKLMNERSIKELARLKDTQQIDRNLLSQRTRLKALELSEILEKSLPNSSWTLRAKSILK